MRFFSSKNWQRSAALMLLVWLHASAAHAELEAVGVEPMPTVAVVTTEATAVSAPAPAPAAEAGPATIAVMAQSDFVPDRAEAGTTSRTGLPDALADRIIERLSKGGRFQVVERAALRRVVVEQRFSAPPSTSDLDRTVEQALAQIGAASGAETGNRAVIPVNPAVAGARIAEGGGTIGTTGALADYNDLIKNYQDLGNAVGAQFLVLGDLEKVDSSVQRSAIPYSKKGHELQEKRVDARLRLRVIDASSGTIQGAATIRTQVSERLFDGQPTASGERDRFSTYDDLGREAAARILDLTFPATIVNVDPLVISRGVNDGVEPGDRFQVERDGKVIRDAGGVVIGHLKQTLGTLQLTSVQANISLAELVNGAGFAVADRVVVVDNGATGALGAAGIAGAAGHQATAHAAAVPTLMVGKLEFTGSAVVSRPYLGQLDRLRDAMMVGLSNSGRFVVVERDEVDQVLDEKLFTAMVSGQDVSASLARLRGSDYLVTGEVTNLYIDVDRQRVPYVDEIQVTVTGVAHGTLRIVDIATGALVAAEKLRLEDSAIDVDDSTRFLSLLIDRFSEQAVALVVSRLYPLKVAAVEPNGVVWLNGGRDAGLGRGDQYDVLRAGRALVDPDTGRSLGRSESRIGSVTIEMVDDGRARGLVSSGDDPRVGDRLVKAAVKAEVAPPAATVIQPAW